MQPPTELLHAHQVGVDALLLGEGSRSIPPIGASALEYHLGAGFADEVEAEEVVAVGGRLRGVHAVDGPADEAGAEVDAEGRLEDARVDGEEGEDEGVVDVRTCETGPRQLLLWGRVRVQGVGIEAVLQHVARLTDLEI